MGNITLHREAWLSDDSYSCELPLDGWDKPVLLNGPQCNGCNGARLSNYGRLAKE